MKGKALRIGVMFMVLIIALAAIGVGYGLWYKLLYIQGTVNTGTVDMAFWRIWTWENDHGKPWVADCNAWVEGDTLFIDIKNGYPSFECLVNYTIVATGTIPVHVYSPIWRELPKPEHVTVRTGPCFRDDYQIHPWDFRAAELSVESLDVETAACMEDGARCHPNFYYCSVYIHVEQGAEQGASYSFYGVIEGRQFNEPR